MLVWNVKIRNKIWKMQESDFEGAHQVKLYWKYILWNTISTHVIDLDCLSLTGNYNRPYVLCSQRTAATVRYGYAAVFENRSAGLSQPDSHVLVEFFSRLFSFFFFFFLHSAITIVIASTCAQRSPINWPDNGCYYYITFRDGYSCHVRRIARAKFGGRHAIGWHRCRTFANPVPPGLRCALTV